MSTGVERLELQSLKFAEMLSSLMLRLELQNMKVAKMLSSTDVTVGAAKYEDKSLYFIFKFILLNIFYSLSLYRWMQAILISSHYLMNMISLILH